MNIKKGAITQTQIPIGSIVAFAGDLSIQVQLDILVKDGWLLCDGSVFNKTNFPELFAVIQYSNGGSSNEFYVPDLRNRFLRGTTGIAADRDPDATSRIAAAVNGATGNRTASLQRHATALPTSEAWQLANNGQHQHSCIHITNSQTNAWSGGNNVYTPYGYTNSDDNGNHYHELTGYDAATAPVNLALFYIIKAKTNTALKGTTPCGAITGYGGTASPYAYWIPCNGLATTKKKYPDLFTIIGDAFGGNAKGNFNVPDLRGYFLRGTNHQSSRDPNASDRSVLNAGGNKGDNIGSLQTFATKKPLNFKIIEAGNHNHTLGNVPAESHQCVAGASGVASKGCMSWTDSTGVSTVNGDHTHKFAGGDLETRPENIYTNFLIVTEHIQAAPPVGSIMSYGGDYFDPSIRKSPADNGWLPCDGTSVRVKTHPELYKVIGNIFGKATSEHFFSLPDLRGVFVIGAGGVPVGTLAESQTGAPIYPIQTTVDGNHQHGFANTGNAIEGVDGIGFWGNFLGKATGAKLITSTIEGHTHMISGGDKESRPINVNVDFIIRYK